MSRFLQRGDCPQMATRSDITGLGNRTNTLGNILFNYQFGLAIRRGCSRCLRYLLRRFSRDIGYLQP